MPAYVLCRHAACGVSLDVFPGANNISDTKFGESVGQLVQGICCLQVGSTVSRPPANTLYLKPAASHPVCQANAHSSQAQAVHTGVVVLPLLSIGGCTLATA